MITLLKLSYKIFYLINKFYPPKKYERLGKGQVYMLIEKIQINAIM